MFKEKVIELINRIDDEEMHNIQEAAKLVFPFLKNEKIIHVFATGHSHMFAEELFYRSGGLVPIDPILKPFLMQHEGAVSSTKFERIEGIAKVIYDGLDLKDNEPFIICSNSGINAVPVEMAKIVKEKKNPLIVVTSISSSKNLKSRVKDGSHLYDYADVLIDNKSSDGDGVISSKYGPIGSTSSIINSYIAQSFVLEVISLYEKNNLTPLIYQSANTLGGDEHNKKILDKYKNRIRDLF